MPEETTQVLRGLSESVDYRELIVKRIEKLREYFPPELVGWNVVPASALMGAKAGDMVTHVPFASVQAVRDRLDAALGLDGWREKYDNPGSYTRCVLEVRFAPDGEWVTRVGVSGAPDLERATAESLRAAALSLGVGRYLTLHPQQVPWDGSRLTHAPRLPDHALPPEYRRAGREAAWKARQLVNTACDESTKRGRDFSQLKRQAANALAHRYGGYLPATPGEDVDLSRMQVRHLAALTRHTNDWLAELAANQTAGQACPFVTADVKDQKAQDGKPAEKYSRETDSAQSPAAQGNRPT
jgi:hypothetical protein